MKKIELSIPKPCHEDWNTMTPEGRGRFCASCHKTVIDFSQMSDSQIADFFKKPKESVCGHFSNSQLNRVIDVPKKRIPWVRYFFTIALPAFLFSLKAGAQGEVRSKGRVAVKTQPDKKEQCEVTTEVVMETKTLKGKVVGENGDPIPFVSVFIVDSQLGTQTNSEGIFELKHSVNKVVDIQISAVGYESKILSTEEFRTNELVTISLTPRVQGEIQVTVGMVAAKKTKTIPLIELKKIDTAFSKFAVSPNPVPAGGSINIEPKKLEAGTYQVQVINSSGEVLQTTEAIIENKTHRITVPLLTFAAGPYFVQLTNRKTNKRFSEIIIVQ